MTTAFIVYRIADSGEKAEFLGLYATKEKAEKEIACIEEFSGDEQDLLFEEVMFVGWGYIGPGDFGHNDPADNHRAN